MPKQFGVFFHKGWASRFKQDGKFLSTEEYVPGVLQHHIGIELMGWLGLDFNGARVRKPATAQAALRGPRVAARWSLRKRFANGVTTPPLRHCFVCTCFGNMTSFPAPTKLRSRRDYVIRPCYTVETDRLFVFVTSSLQHSTAAGIESSTSNKRALLLKESESCCMFQLKIKINANSVQNQA